ncbi:heme peroxidase family protein [Dyadobacter chenwenxiniae]|uniref:Heme peroxidase family protein n=1 Tax=Dyadobacter chenwenxiniae TaxID=2906456 RepID=A0A9X1TJW5_9BACT|nr:heme peroxidase family protein [Dyadobacter chenwenxiniae]MCF0060568.1 heme peroxidase family protein [Dyadobacter chenwenxiniae]UON86299.1 heme peroxidase family protein [Dyadobacter chenwenxiniae]
MNNPAQDARDPNKKSTGIPVAKNERKIARGHGFGTRTEECQPLGQFSQTGKFGRLFPLLKPLVPPAASLEALGAAMIDSVTVDINGPVAHPDGDNDNLPAGYTYFGQFVDHDITLDTTSLQEILVDPLAVTNFRTPMLDLDSIYGSGPVANPYLYQRDNNGLFLIGNTSNTPPFGDPSVPVSLPNDLPRNSEGFALIGDPRNDENLVVAQLHLAFLKFHNKVVEGLVDGSIPRESPLRKSTFEEARDLVIWHYQWIVLHDFLPRILDPVQLNDVLVNGRKFYNINDDIPFIPVEFSVAAYRFGHSMVREAYNYNRVFGFGPGAVTPATLELLFEFSGLSSRNPQSSVPIPSDWIIDWRQFLEIEPNIKPELSRGINPLIIPKLHDIPGLGSLAVRNLKRGSSMGLPPGQSIARLMAFTPLTPDEIATGADGEVAAAHDLHLETPLWYYILKEAEIQGDSKHLGQVGSRIVAEVFIGLLKADSSSFLARKPEWVPTLGVPGSGNFTLADLVRFVGEINQIGDTFDWRATVDLQPVQPTPGGTLSVVGKINMHQEIKVAQLQKRIPQGINPSILQLEIIKIDAELPEGIQEIRYEENLTTTDQYSSIEVFLGSEVVKNITDIQIVQ